MENQKITPNTELLSKEEFLKGLDERVAQYNHNHSSLDEKTIDKEKFKRMYITSSDWGNRSEQSRNRARKCPPKKSLRLKSNTPSGRFLEAAQQICYHSDHSPLSEAECRSILKNRQVFYAVSVTLDQCSTQIIES